MKVLTPQAMRGVDRAAVEEFGIPSLVLMENAAIGVADAIGERFPEVRSVAIYCGPGNNGGDGLALARHLAIRSYGMRVFLLTSGREPGGDAGIQLAICRNQGLFIVEIGPSDDLRPALEAGRDGGLVVDALFGTGLARPLEGHFAELASALSRLPVPRLAIDLPSGLAGGSGAIPGPHFEADLTVTFAALKPAHVLPPAADVVGEVVVADLGIPPELVERAEGRLHLLTAEELAGCLMPRAAGGHKGDYGHALLVAGSPGKAGAVILAAQGAVRGGAGLVTAAVPASMLPAVDAGSLESMTLALTAGGEGALAAPAAEEVLAAAADKQVLALGPGLGQGAETVAVIRRLVREAKLPLVIDADGLNAFSGDLAALAGRPAETVLTPHPGELGRLLGVPAAEVQADRVVAARRAAGESGCIVVLKGRLSLVAAPAGEVYVNPTGNPGMATGGTGDVLTGLIAALIAQGYEPLLAAQLGVFAHGLAGDLARESRGMIGLKAGDLLEALPAAFERIARA